MKRSIGFLISGIVLLCTGLFFGWKFFYKQSIISIPLTDGTELFFFASGSTTKAIQKQFDCDFAINGSYFGGEETGVFYPAGIRYEDEDKRYLWENRPFDANLTNTLRFYQNSKKADFFFEHSSVEAASGSIVFNAGPRLLQAKKINPQLNRYLSHWNFTVPRTVIAKKEGDQLFLLLFRKGETLHKVALWLQEKGFEDAINLDGGPSTALTSRSFFRPSFNEARKLPIFFCVKGEEEIKEI